MDRSFMDSKSFEGIDIGDQVFPVGDYENCNFKRCLLSNSDLSNMNFVECHFLDCDMSMAGLNGAAFREALFENCKLMGLHFNECNEILFSAQYTRCDLTLASFYSRSLTNSGFLECKLHEVDFTDADLSGVKITGCDLTGSIFNQTNLEKADLRTSFNFSIDPELNRIRNATFSAGEVAGLLDKYDITIE